MKNRQLVIAVLLLVAMLLSACGSTAAAPAATEAPAPAAAEGNGEFTASAKGIGGDVVVTLTLKDGVIVGCTAQGDGETQGIGSVVIDTFPAIVAENNSIGLDAVSSATVTSTAFLTAAADALTQAGLNPDDFKTPIAAEEADTSDVTLEADVVIVGAGGAGMTAAIKATDNGAKVIIVESQSMVGGNSIRSTGGMNAAATEWQDSNEFGESAAVEATLAKLDSWKDNEAIQALGATVKEQWAAYQANPDGYFDSVELAQLDTLIGGKGLNNPDLVKTLCENGAAAIEWLDSNDIVLHNVAQFGGASVKRIHRPVNDEGKVVSVGAYVVPLLQKNCEDRGIEIVLNTTVDTILMDESGAACGVSGVNDAGANVTVNAKAVIIATGGFGANLDMVTQYNPALEGFMTTNAAGAQGQGIAMATAVGAGTVDLDQIQIHPTVEANTAALITEGLRGDGAILVNINGERFFNETETRDKVSAAEIAQPESYSYLIVDQKMVDASAVIQGYIKKGFTTEGETYEALAEALGIPAETFAETMNTWNGYVADKNDPDFGRVTFASALDTAPYYAIKVTAGIHHCMGGITINTNAEVLTEAGDVIPGLFAAGEVTGGVHGGNRLGGNAVADFTIFGMIAGDSASAYAAA